MQGKRTTRVAVSFLIACFLISVLGAAPSLPAYNVNTNLTSVSGLSAGGYMAVQMHIAYSASMIGAGVIAGGPYNCAEGSLTKAQVNCMYANSPPNTQPFIQTTNSRSASGSIDDISNLPRQRVYLFSGTKDTTVKPAVMDALNTYYENYITASGAIVYENTLSAAHTYPTVFQTLNNCGISQSPYLSYCNYDGAGYILNHIFNNQLNPRSADLTGQIISFDQSEFYSNLNSISMDDTGYAYVPSECALGASCFVHVAFHGCLQSHENVGMDFVNYAGYNEWAETNNIIILYPQAKSSAINPQNPNACFDWWGYTNANNYDTKNGAQMQMIKEMIDRVGGNYADFLDAPTNLVLVNNTDFSVAFKWNAVDEATGYVVYRYGIFVAQLKEQLSFEDTGLASGSRFEYTVAALASTGQQGPLSAVLVAYTTGNPPPLSPPTSLSAQEISSNSVVLVWEYVLGADRYNVYRNSVFVSTTNTNTFTDLNLSPSSTYTYTVTSENSNGVSGFSTPLSVTTNSAFQCSSYTDSNYGHVINGRAYAKLGNVYANGSDQYMGLYNIFVYTLLSQTSPGYYVIGSC